MKDRTAILLIVLAGFLAFGGALRNGFVWDDINHVLRNPNLQSVGSATVYFVSDEGLGSGEELPYYRPLTMLSFAMDNVLWKRWPAGYHAVNLALHLAACVLLFLGTRMLTGHPGAALAATLLFAVHPAAAEPVSYISARADILCGLFLALALLFHLRGEKSSRGMERVAEILAFALALLSKIIALAFPFLLLLRLLLSGKGKKAFGVLAPYAAVIVPFLFLRGIAVTMDTWMTIPLGIRLSVAPVLLSRYLRYTFLPVGLKVFYGDSLAPYAGLSTIAALLTLAGVLYLVVRNARAMPGAAFGAAWYFAMLLPVSGILTVIYPAPMADRYLYVPMLGATVALATVVERFGIFEGEPRTKRYWASAFGLAAIILTVVSIQRLPAWRDPMSLWGTAAAQSPGNPYVLNRLGNALAFEKRYDEAEEVFLYLLERGEDKFTYLNNLANVAMYKGELDRAEGIAVEGLSRNPSHWRLWFTLGEILARKEDPSGAEAALRKSLALNPDNPPVLRAIGRLQGGRPDDVGSGDKGADG